MSYYDELTPKQKAFVDAYITCFNITNAFIEAGYSTNAKRSTINRNAWKLFKNPKVAKAIQEALDEVKEDRDCLVEKMVKKCLDMMDDDELKPTEKIKSMEMLSKLIGVADRVDVKSDGELSFNFIIEGSGEEVENE